MERHIPFAHWYSVSDAGEVFSVLRGRKRQLRPRGTRNGHLRVTLFVAGEKIEVGIHRLVALMFIGSPPTPRHEARHLNGDPTDNRVENISWGTHAENMADMSRHIAEGVKVRSSTNQRRGETSHNARLTEDQVRVIRRRLATGEKLVRIAETYGVSWITIWDIRERRTWKHVAEESGS